MLGLQLLNFANHYDGAEHSPPYSGQIKTYEFETRLDNLAENFIGSYAAAKNWHEFVNAIKKDGFEPAGNYIEFLEQQNWKNVDVYVAHSGIASGFSTEVFSINKTKGIVTFSKYQLDLRPRRAPVVLNYLDYDDDYDWDYDSSTTDHSPSQADLDNHANQCNPNNDAYHSSRR